MEARHGEGIANHTGPEPCVVIRKDHGEASVSVSHALERIRQVAGQGRRNSSLRFCIT